jgi:enoyl-CoA hydratase/carnithine racemase
MGQPEILVGFPPGAGGSQRLTRAVGTSRALELILEGRPIGPEEALDLGIVHRVVPAAELQAEAAAAAERMARRAPEAVAAVKRVVLEGGSLPLAAGLALERKWFLSAVSTPASRRAMKAYVEEVDTGGGPPFADRDRQAPWLEGTAADLVGESEG